MVLARCSASGCGERNVDLAAGFLYRHMIEMTDGIEVLVRQSAITPAIPLVRSSFEAWLALTYILEDSAQYRTRALSWIAHYALVRREGHRRMDRTRPENVEFEADRRDDLIGDKVADVKHEDIQRAIRNMDEMLDDETLSPFRDAFERIRGNGRRRTVFWAELHGGPGSVYRLAKHLRHGLKYHLLYGDWSMTGHAGDFSHFFVPAGDKAGIRPLRRPDELRGVGGDAAAFLLDATRIMLNHFRHGEDSYGRWYVANVQALFRAVRGMRPPEGSTAP
jgi:hypothetical protein